MWAAITAISCGSTLEANTTTGHRSVTILRGITLEPIGGTIRRKGTTPATVVIIGTTATCAITAGTGTADTIATIATADTVAHTLKVGSAFTSTCNR